MKRYLADRYANSNVMKPDILSGISEHAKDFLNQCTKACITQGYADIYVSLGEIHRFLECSHAE